MRTDTFLRTVANTISAITYPMFVPTYAVTLLSIALRINNPLFPTGYFLLCIGGTLVFTLLIPLSSVMLLKRSVKLQHLYMDDRRERTIPYIYTIVAAAIWCYFLYKVLRMPSFVVSMAIAATLCIAIVAFINHFWKISAHLCLWGSLTGAVVGYCYRTSINAPILISVLLLLAWAIMWARLYLDKHTAAQVISGYLLGLTTTASAILI